MAALVTMINCSNGTVGNISGDSDDALLVTLDVNDVTIGNLKHISTPKSNNLSMSIKSVMYNHSYSIGNNNMTSNKQSCTIVAENSNNIKIGNIHSDADQVTLLKGVDGFTTGDIYHFTKSTEEVDKVFEVIQSNIKMHKLPDDIQTSALDLSSKLREAYLSKDTMGFKAFYQEMTSFLSNHATLYMFVYPTFVNLINTLSN